MVPSTDSVNNFLKFAPSMMHVGEESECQISYGNMLILMGESAHTNSNTTLTKKNCKWSISGIRSPCTEYDMNCIKTKK